MKKIVLKHKLTDQLFTMRKRITNSKLRLLLKTCVFSVIRGNFSFWCCGSIKETSKQSEHTIENLNNSISKIEAKVSFIVVHHNVKLSQYTCIKCVNN